jgi:hypothetical protein
MAAPGFLLRAGRSARRLTGVSVLTAALGAASLAALPAAQAAAGTPARGSVTRTASIPGQRAIPARAIRCKIGVTLVFPHPITAVGVVKCSGRVARIALRVRIFRGSNVVSSRGFTKTNVRTLKGATSAGCRAGSFWARADGKVKLFSGHILTGHASTRRIRIRC